MVIFAFLPSIIEPILNKQLTKHLNLKNFQSEIKKISLFNTIIGNIKTGKGQDLEIDLINIDYSLNSILGKKIKKITISGLTIKANIDINNKIKFNDFNFNKLGSSPDNDSNTDPFAIPFLPEKIEIKNSKIILNLPSRQINLPVSLSVQIKTKNGILVSDGVLMPLGGKIKIHAAIDFRKKYHNIQINSDSIDLGLLSQFLKGIIPNIDIPDNTMLDINTNLIINKKILKTHGKLTLNTPFTSPLLINFKSDLDINTFDSLTFNAETQPMEKFSILIKNQKIILNHPDFKLNLTGAPLKGTGTIFLTSKKIVTKFKNRKASVEKTKIQSIVTYDFTKKNNSTKIVTNIKLNRGNIQADGHKIKIKKFDLKLPFSIPYKTLKKPYQGKFTLAKCILDDKYTLKANGDLSRINKGILVRGNISSPDIKNFKINFNSKALMLPAKGICLNLDFNSRPCNFNQKNLMKFIPKQADTIDFNLNLSSKGKIEYTSKGLQSNLKININNGNINIPDNKLFIKGFATNLEIKDLLSMQSQPGQILNINSIKLNDITMNKAVIKYDIESMNSLLIESTKIEWCNGIISSEAIRLPDKNNNYSIIFYCDRLELSEILKQIGAFRAQGNGTMNGRIPVRYSNGEIKFDNGFLFSTPGKGGKIIIDKADKLTQGIPMGTPQFSQLDLAREALKNYDYKWAKLGFNTSEDTLLVNMKFDGSPSNKVLPFEYKKELGRFVRVSASSPGSHFQGIKLDINLKVPFNQVMKFGNKIKKAFK